MTQQSVSQVVVFVASLFLCLGFAMSVSYGCPDRECVPCGDGVCDASLGENCFSCSLDCGLCQGCPNVTCGDSYCDGQGGETGCNCPEDCACCVDGFCGPSETYENCPRDCGAALRGIVVDAADYSPLPGSNVVCGPWGAELTFNQITNGQARFEFTSIPPGLYRCTAEYGISISSTYTFYVSPGSNLIPNRTEVIPITLPTGLLSGVTVFRPTGQPFPDARVICTSGKERREAFSDDNGVYLFTGVRAGNYTCQATYPGYSSDQGRVSVPRGAAASLNLFLDKIKGGINGNVLDCTTGFPVESKVTCVTSSGTFTTNTTRGYYSFSNVASGVAVCTATPFDTGYCPGNNTGVVPPSLNLTLNIIVAAVPSNLSGFVFDNDTRAPLPGADVVCSTQGAVYATISLTDGRWSLVNVTAGNYTCYFSREGYNSTFLTGISVPSYTVRQAPNAYLSRLRGCVRLTVFNPYTYAGSNATVTCYDDSGRQVTNTVTPPSGQVFLINVLPGMLTCTVRLSGYADRTVSIPVPPGDQNVEYDFQLIPSMGSFTVNVADNTGAQLRGAAVTCTNPLTRDVYTSTSDSFGKATFTSIPVGTYSCVTSYSSGYAPVSFVFNLTSAVTPSFNSVLQIPSASISGRVVDSTLLTPLAGAAVNCSSTSGVTKTFTTDQSGIFVFNGLNNFGPWRCSVTLTGYYMSDTRGFIPVSVTPGSSSTLQVGLVPQNGFLQVSVTNNAGEFLPTAKLYCGRQNESKMLVAMNAQAGATLSYPAGLYSCTAMFEPLYLPVTSSFVEVRSGLTSTLRVVLNPVAVSP